RASPLATVTRAFDRQHADKPAAIVLVLDHFWCMAPDVAAGQSRPFPYWLYGSDDWEYLRDMLFPAAVEGAAVRMAILLGLQGGVGPADGYGAVTELPVNAMSAKLLAETPRPSHAPAIDAPFPEVDDLNRLGREIDPRTRLLLVFPPVHVSV